MKPSYAIGGIIALFVVVLVLVALLAGAIWGDKYQDVSQFAGDGIIFIILVGVAAIGAFLMMTPRETPEENETNEKETRNVRK